MNRPEGRASGSRGAAVRMDIASILEKSDQMVVALLESAAQAIVGSDSSGRIVLANARTEAMFGYARQELLGNRIEMLLPEAARTRHEQDRADYFAKPRVREMGAGMELSG